MKSALERFAANQADSESWRETIAKRIDNINYHDAKIQMRRFICGLPPGLVELPERFSDDVIEFRNTLVHDVSRIKTEDYNKLAFYVAKLKAIYAVSDAVALGGARDDIRNGSYFLSSAKHMPLNSFADDA